MLSCAFGASCRHGKRSQHEQHCGDAITRERLQQRRLPHHEAWRCQGEYAGGCLCDGCGERIASAQASYEVDFPPGGQPACLLTYSNAGAE